MNNTQDSDYLPPLASKEEDEVGEYYFESDALALKDNHDYHKLIKALVKLQAQRMKAVKVRRIKKNKKVNIYIVPAFFRQFLVVLQEDSYKYIFQDVDRLHEVRGEVLKDPTAFVMALQNGENLNLPNPQEIVEVGTCILGWIDVILLCVTLSVSESQSLYFVCG